MGRSPDFLAFASKVSILPALLYGATIVLHLVVRKRLDRKEGAFDLGRFELPGVLEAEPTDGDVFGHWPIDDRYYDV